MDGRSSEVEGEVKLKKKLGLVSGTSLIVGVMIGSGIFISPSYVTYAGGSVAVSLLLWGACGIITTIGSLCQAELGTLIQLSGGGYTYLNAAYGPIPAFMLAWMTTVALRPAGLSIVALTCSRYILSPIFDDGCGAPPVLILKLLTAFIILTLLIINIYSIRLAALIQVVFTAAKLIAVAVVIIGGIVMLAQGKTDILATGFEGSNNNVGSIAIGLYAGMWAYDGWNTLNDVIEELDHPHKNLPRAIMIALPLVTVCYVLMNVSYFTVLTPFEVVTSPAVAMSWAARVIPSVPLLLPVFVAMSTFGALNGAVFAGARMPFVAARNGHMMTVISMVDVKHNSPSSAAIFTCVLSLIFLIPGDVQSLLSFFSFAVWMFHTMTASTVIYFRVTRKHDHRPFKVPIFLPVIMVLASLFLVVAPIALDPKIEFLYAFIFIIAGFIFYVPLVHFKLTPPCMSHVTTFWQLLLQISPQDAKFDQKNI